MVQVVDKLKGETRELAATNLAKSEEQAEIRNQVTPGCCVLMCVAGWNPGAAASGRWPIGDAGQDVACCPPHRARMQAV